MNIEDQNSTDLTHLSHLIQDMTAGMLTSFDASGALVSRPMSPLEMTCDGAIWFFTDLKSGKIGHLQVANLSFTNESGVYMSQLRAVGKFTQIVRTLKNCGRHLLGLGFLKGLILLTLDY